MTFNLARAALTAILCGCGGSSLDAAPAAVDATAPVDVVESADVGGGAGDSDGGAGAGACGPLRSTPAGGCCPAGEVALGDGACAAVGPRGCVVADVASGGQCAITWCSAWRDAHGATCSPSASGCVLRAAPCGEGGGDAGACPAGASAVDDSGACHPVAGPGPLELVDAAAELPPPPTEPPPPTWCPDSGTGRAAPCGTTVLACPAGSVPDPVGSGCVEPGPTWLCPPGFSESAGASPPGCMPDGAACEAPDGRSDTLHVEVGAGGRADGSVTSPYGTLAEALAEAKPGATIVLGPGEHAGGVVVDRPVTIRGSCAAPAVLSGPSGGATIRFVLSASESSSFSDVTVTGGSPGIEVASGTLTGSRLMVQGATGRAVDVRGSSSRATLRDSVVVGTQPDPDGNAGHGVTVWGGAAATLERVRLAGNRAIGLVVSGAASSVEATEVRVDGTLPQQKDSIRGDGLCVLAGARLDAHQVTLADNHNVAFQVLDAGSSATVTGLRVTGTRLEVGSGGMYGGDAVIVGPSASLVLEGALLRGNPGIGLGAIGPKVDVAATGIRVDDTGLEAGTGYYNGVTLVGGGDFRLEAIDIRGRSEAALVAGDDGTKAAIDGLVIDCADGDEPPLGPGVSVAVGADVSLSDATVHGCVSWGLTAGRDSVVDLRRVNVVDTAEDDEGTGYGMQVLSGARATMHDVRIARSRGTGLMIANAGVTVLASRLVVDGTQGTIDGSWGTAITVRDGARLELAGGRLSSNRHGGVMVADAGAAILAGVVVDDTGPEASSGLYGVGFGAVEQAILSVDGCTARGNHMAALLVDSSSAVVDDSELIETEFASLTMPDGSLTEFADGVLVVRGGALESHRVLAARNGRAGWMFDAAGTSSVSLAASIDNLYGWVEQGTGAVQSEALATFENELANVLQDGQLSVPPPPTVATPKL